MLIVLLDQYICEFLLTIFTHHQNHVLLLPTLTFTIFFFLFYSLYCRSEVLRSCFPVVSCLFETFGSGFTKLSFLFLFVLFYYVGLNYTQITCYFEAILFASELNYFLLDMKTILQALACFSRAFRLNLRPQPSGHKIKSVSFSGCSLDYSTSSSLIIGF